MRLIGRPLLVFFLFSLPGIGLSLLFTRSTAALNQATIDSIRNGDGDASATFARLLNEIREALLSWTFLLMVVGLAVAIGWTFLAMLKEKDIEGPSDKAAAQPAWWLGLIAQPLAAATLQLTFIARLGLTGAQGIAEASGLWLNMAAIALFGLLAYWVATAWSAGETMRPSVPFASRLDRKTGGAR